jgi:catechol 2,3-dioxygenase-like lactoylglutathione lyase family enzyme
VTLVCGRAQTGIVVTMFITVRSVARSRDFYSRVLGGTVVLEENPCIVKLSNSWILMNPGGPPTPDKPGISVVNYEPGDTTSISADGAPPQDAVAADGGRVSGGQPVEQAAA